MIQFTCVKCNQLSQIPEQAAGRCVACPKCKQELIVPAASGLAFPPVPPSAPALPTGPTPQQPIEVNRIRQVAAGMRPPDRGLGPLIEILRVELFNLAVDFILTAGSIGLTVAALLFLPNRLDLDKPAAKVVFGIILVVGVLISVYRCIETNRVWKLKVVLYRDGFVYISAQQEETIRYDAVANISSPKCFEAFADKFEAMGHEVSREYTATIMSTAGQKVVIKYPLNSLGIAWKLGEQVARVNCEFAWEQLRQGTSVSFGPLAVTPAGLSDGTRLLPWADLAGLRVDDESGYLLVYQHGNSEYWAVALADNVTYLDALMLLVDKFVPGRIR